MHATASPTEQPATSSPRPLVVGHRGAPAYRPEHTAASFELAIDLGADFIEPDVVVSRDGALIVRHDRELSLTTDVAHHPEFAHRRATKLICGVPVEDWFVEDFDFAELRTLRTKERMPALRRSNTAYDGQFGLLTLGEVIELAARRSTDDHPVGVLVELAPGLPAQETELPRLVVDELRRLDVATAAGPIILQSFEPRALRELRSLLGDDGPPMVQLVEDGPGYDWMITPDVLRETAAYAVAIGASRHRLLLRDTSQRLLGVSRLMDRAHHAGLRVFAWKLLPENAFLPLELRRGTDPAVHGDAQGDARRLLQLGADALITDVPEIAVRARAERNGARRLIPWC